MNITGRIRCIRWCFRYRPRSTHTTSPERASQMGLVLFMFSFLPRILSAFGFRPVPRERYWKRDWDRRQGPRKFSLVRYWYHAHIESGDRPVYAARRNRAVRGLRDRQDAHRTHQPEHAAAVRGDGGRAVAGNLCAGCRDDASDDIGCEISDESGWQK